MKLNPVFVVVKRDNFDQVDIRATRNFKEACVLQKAMLIGVNPELVLNILNDEDYKIISEHLSENGRDSLQNENCEVIIFGMPSV